MNTLEEAKTNICGSVRMGVEKKEHHGEMKIKGI